jgi:hypothetical protein
VELAANLRDVLREIEAGNRHGQGDRGGGEDASIQVRPSGALRAE